MKKCLVKKSAYIEDDDLYRWVEHKELISEALDEAWQYIVTKINSVKTNIEEIKNAAEDYEGKLNNISDDFEKAKLGSKRLGPATDQ